MKILIIEDSELKFALLQEFIANTWGGVNLVRAASYQSGIERLVREPFDWVILDMTLPVSDLHLSPIGMEYLPFGGQCVLRECARRKIVTRFVVVTQYSTFVRNQSEVSFQQLQEEIQTRFADLVEGCVYLDRDSDRWKMQLKTLMSK